MQKNVFSNTNLWLKIIISPTLLLILSHLLNQHIKFPADYYTIGLALIYAMVAQLLEMKYYEPDRLYFLTVFDFILAVSLLYVFGKGFTFLGTSISFTGALIYGVLQAAVEHIHHIFLKPRKKKWQKEKRRKK